MSDIGPPDWKQEYEEADHLREILTGRLNEFTAIWKRHHPEAELRWPDVGTAFEEVAQLLARYRWRPIAELHEDYGPCVGININDPGYIVIIHACDTDPDESITHFTQITPLTHGEAAQMLAEGDPTC